MPTLAPRFNWGDEVKNINPTLYNQLNDSYTNTARVTNTKSSRFVFNTNPQADDPVNVNFDKGDF